MNAEEFRNFCLKKPGVTEGFPFGEPTLVFKVMNKMFALCDIDQFEYINLKCDPDLVPELREQFAAVKPGYHMNKKHWNSVYVNEDASDQQVYQWTDDSYELIVQSLPKKLQAELENMQ
ncbi:MmcQ/YjbR family DNA-binding protein [Reichenbachiella ulvae]|uniref:MmcQ/YjbR family DNA-binding protein n=1 Tax=Reichenbachiella ulvae TaxID=2980104 RepID=A0ABT3CZB4_9BACT|nr:MmcQ/YjbR family DNA-binding protein [Reichenbachiella ulvae]MCV9388972.1 MmcQ/YjbR family DNA-binding protein [Reichenbachiella ulvae]